MKSFFFNRLIPKIYRFYLSINLKTQRLEIKPEDKCLCLAPHADDESIGMGGCLYKYPKNFKVIILTNGVKGAKKYSPEEAMKVRKQELSNAMKIASIEDFEFIDADDKHILTEYDKFSKIDISEYDYIFVPNILDQHVDHKSVSINLARLLKEKKHKTNLKIAFYEVWSALPVPNAFVDISEVVDKKEEMINSHISQVEIKDYTSKAIALNSYRGLPHDVPYAEAFLVLDEKTFFKIAKIV